MSKQQNQSYQAQAAEIIEGIDTDLTRYIRLGWLFLFAGIGGFIIWACLAPLDKGVPLHGTVTVSSNQKAVQHEAGGTVDEILVKEGEVVPEGQVLIRMNPIHAASAAESTRVQFITSSAMQARLIAERDGLNKIDFNSVFTETLLDPTVQESIALQQQVFQSRRSAIRSTLLVIDKTIVTQHTKIDGLTTAVNSKATQKAAITKQLNNIRGLADEGYMPANRVLELEQNLASLDAQIAADQGNIASAKSEVETLKLEKIQRKREYQKEVSSQLAEVQQRAGALKNDLLDLDRNVENISVKAPVGGAIVGLAVFTKGAVIPAGFTVMSIVPENDQLVVEGQLPVHLVDKVHSDLPVNLLFTAFNQNETPTIPGIVTQVSADRFTDENTGMPFYKVVSKVAPNSLDLIKDLKIRPGMPVEMFIKTGERSLMNYLLKPLFDHLQLALSEE